MNSYGWSRLTRRDKEAILRGVRDGSVHGGPFHVEIHPSSRCGLGCFFCSTRSWRTREDLPLEIINRLASEMRALGTRSVCLSGGGEPLSHPRILDVINILTTSGVPVSHLTTNGQNLDLGVVDALIDARCDDVIVSLNCGDDRSYAAMMRTTPAMFSLVSSNVAALLERRRRRGVRRPAVILQFLVYRENHQTVPAMYEHARSLGVDGVIFNGLSFLPSEMKMTPAETEVMASHLETVMLHDEYRGVLGIGSFEQDVSGMVEQIEARIGEERNRLNRVERLWATLARRDFTLRDKWAHHWKMRRSVEIRRLLRDNVDPCIRPWYSMTVRSDGTVPVCCARQERILADVRTSSVSEIWFGTGFARLRSAMGHAIRQGPSWAPDRAAGSGVESRCSAATSDAGRCPFRSSYFSHDLRFLHRLALMVGSDGGAR
jgi:MoaA/NifB/PqqE/SkfB family radical SAM enzyme